VTAYIDTSALLRLVLREPGALEDLLSCVSQSEREVPPIVTGMTM
jgi:hypothetical protein